nr:LysE family transporter [Leucobacter edaphi]
MLAISLTPGAGAINTMSNAMTVGWRRSIWGVLGQQLALIVHLAIVAAGVGVIVANSPALFEGIRYVGAAYLVYLGLRLIFAKPETADPEAPSDLPGESNWSILRRGFWVNLLNPKAVVFFLAFIPQFVSPERDLARQYLVLGLTVVAIDVIVMWGFFAVVARSFRRITATRRGQLTLNRVFGSLFVGVAALLLFVH